LARPVLVSVWEESGPGF